MIFTSGLKLLEVTNMSIKTTISNQIRDVNGRLGQVTLNGYGRYFAVSFGLDGASIIDVNSVGASENIKDYLEGDNEVTYFAVPSNVTKLCNYALASFPNIETIYITNYEQEIDLSAPNCLGGLTNPPTIYVPKKYYDDYVEHYPSYNFATWVDNADLYISNNGNPTLTLDYVNAVVYGLDIGTDASITRTFLGSDFTTFEFGAMDFVFDGKVPNSTIELDNETLFLSSAYDTTQTGVTLEVE